MTVLYFSTVIVPIAILVEGLEVLLSGLLVLGLRLSGERPSHPAPIPYCPDTFVVGSAMSGTLSRHPEDGTGTKAEAA
jgi:hypothetical protein